MRTIMASLAFALLLLSGCQRAPDKLVKVEGTITLEGKALPNVSISFLPDPFAGTLGPRSTATSDANGNYTLMCDNQKEGAVVGAHLVVVEDPERRPPAQGSNEPVSPGRVPAFYQEARTTPLTVTVPEGGGTIKLELAANPQVGVRPKRKE